MEKTRKKAGLRNFSRFRLRWCINLLRDRWQSMIFNRQLNPVNGSGIASADTAGAKASEWFTPFRFGAILTIGLIGTFWKLALGQDSFFFRDYGVIGYPFIYYHHQCFWQGELPLWNPYSNCGAPYLAQWGTMVLYTISLIYLLFPLPWSLSYF